MGLGMVASVYILSRKLSSMGIPSLIPLRLRISLTTWKGLVVMSLGSPGRICQWSKTHCGKAWPPVLERRSAVKPGETGKMSEPTSRQSYSWAITGPMHLGYTLGYASAFTSRRFRTGLTERFVDRQIGLNNEHWGSHDLALLEHMATSPVQHTVDSTNDRLWALKETTQPALAHKLALAKPCNSHSPNESYQEIILYKSR